ncbi:MAG: hypothetical protein L3K13_06730 [Thermoplasmata archaeon]|nr:hypothetical protein [Thermoplasmata archaeon]
MSASISPRRRGDEPEERCAVTDCPEPAVRSLARSEVRKAFPKLPEEPRRANLCRAHYREFKKATREARTLGRLDW